MFRNGLITSWQGLLQALEIRFAPSFYDDPKGALFKLTQKGSVNEYLTDFERLANRIVGLHPSSLLSCFISGLPPEIRREVQALQPVSLPQATTLAILQEDKIEDRKRGYKSKGNFSSPITPVSNTTKPFSPPQSQSQTQTNPTHTRPQFKKLSPEEITTSREKGLCYNCDDKWSISHKCKGQFFLIVAEDDDDEVADPTPPPVDSPPPATEDPSDVQISFNALAGTSAAETLRLFGTVARSKVTILIDGGSTHNFIHARMAKFLGLPTAKAQALKVMVGDGAVLACEEICPMLQWKFRDKSLTWIYTYCLLAVLMLF